MPHGKGPPGDHSELEVEGKNKGASSSSASSSSGGVPPAPLSSEDGDVEEEKSERLLPRESSGDERQAAAPKTKKKKKEKKKKRGNGRDRDPGGDKRKDLHEQEEPSSKRRKHDHQQHGEKENYYKNSNKGSGKFVHHDQYGDHYNSISNKGTTGSGGNKGYNPAAGTSSNKGKGKNSSLAAIPWTYTWLKQSSGQKRYQAYCRFWYGEINQDLLHWKSKAITWYLENLITGENTSLTAKQKLLFNSIQYDAKQGSDFQRLEQMGDSEWYSTCMHRMHRFMPATSEGDFTNFSQSSGMVRKQGVKQMESNVIMCTDCLELLHREGSTVLRTTSEARK